MVKFAVEFWWKSSDDFPQQKKLENLLPNFAGSSPPISPKTSPTSLWKSLVLRNGVRKNGVRNRCPYRRCGVDTEIPYRLPFWKEFCWFLPLRVAPGVDTEFPYRVRIVDRGVVDCHDPACRHRFRFLEIQHLDVTKEPGRFTTRPLRVHFTTKKVCSKAVFCP